MVRLRRLRPVSGFWCSSQLVCDSSFVLCYQHLWSAVLLDRPCVWISEELWLSISSSLLLILTFRWCLCTMWPSAPSVPAVITGSGQTWWSCNLTDAWHTTLRQRVCVLPLFHIKDDVTAASAGIDINPCSAEEVSRAGLSRNMWWKHCFCSCNGLAGFQWGSVRVWCVRRRIEASQWVMRLSSQPQAYLQQAQDLVILESIILQTLGKLGRKSWVFSLQKHMWTVTCLTFVHRESTWS